MNLPNPALVLLMAATGFAAHASSLETANAIQIKTDSASVVSQQKIDQSATNAAALQAEIDQLNQAVDNLTIYRDHLTALVADQQREMASLEQQLANISQTRQGIVPLMYRMIDGLQLNMEQDKPIRLAARQARIAKLKALMPQADVSDAEKYRRILEAYQIEMDYGTKLGVYQDRIPLTAEDAVEAEILYLGRVSLIARNLNATQYWTWDQTQRHWQALDSHVKADLDPAYQLANQQRAPTLLTLPVSLTRAESNE